MSALEALCRLTTGVKPPLLWEMAGYKGSRALHLIPESVPVEKAKAANDTPALEPQSAGSYLSPPVECELAIGNDVDSGSALDLDAGRTIKVPSGLGRGPAQSFADWMFQQHLGKKGFGLCNKSCN